MEARRVGEVIAAIVVATMLAQDGGAAPSYEGKWMAVEGRYEFMTLNADHTANLQGRPMLWRVSGDALYLTDSHGDTDRFSCHLAGDQLDLTAPNGVLTLVRKGSALEASLDAPVKPPSKETAPKKASPAGKKPGAHR